MGFSFILRNRLNASPWLISPIRPGCSNPLTSLHNSPFSFFVFGLFAISWAAPMAYEGSQARGLIGAIAAGRGHSHSNAESEPRLQSTPQLMATPDP